MARDLDAKCRQCRREGEKLFLKGEKCFTDKCAIERRSYAPGQHGQDSGGRLSDFGKQLRVKGSVAAAETRGFPEWIEVNAKEMKGTFKALPARSDLPSTINESLVVELYSR